VNGGPEQPPAPPDPVTVALKDWRQGDCVVADETFVHRFRPGEPLTDDAKQIDNGANEYVQSDVRGLVVVSQSCDIVRNATAKPFIEVSPLVAVSAGLLHEIKKLRRPNYVFVPNLEAARLVGDLDRTMTIEKSVVAHWPRTLGCRTDKERASFAFALSRKRARFAFPDDFNEWVAPLQNKSPRGTTSRAPRGAPFAHSTRSASRPSRRTGTRTPSSSRSTSFATRGTRSSRANAGMRGSRIG